VNILIEKPLATSLEGIEMLHTTIETRGLAARVAYVHRCIPVLTATREVILSGTIGDVRHIVVNAGQDFPLARPAYASTYYANRLTGGGCIQDALTHSLHTAEWMAGPIKSVYCDASHEVLSDVDVEDTVNLTARMGNQIPAAFSMNQFQAPGELTFTFHAVKGSARAELHANRMGTHLKGEEGWKWQNFPSEGRDKMFVRQATAFLDLLKGGTSVLTTLQEGLQTLKVNLAALESAATRKEILL
jgi:predicted dehydrogenase